MYYNFEFESNTLYQELLDEVSFLFKYIYSKDNTSYIKSKMGALSSYFYYFF